MKVFGYHRTSTAEQHLDRGIKEITEYFEKNNLPLRRIREGIEAKKGRGEWDDYGRPHVV